MLTAPAFRRKSARLSIHKPDEHRSSPRSVSILEQIAAKTALPFHLCGNFVTFSEFLPMRALFAASRADWAWASIRPVP
jgi:hypothetical protein